MEKWIVVLMLLFVNILSPCYALPKAEADPNADANPNIIIQVKQVVGADPYGSDQYGSEYEEDMAVDHHDEGSCNHWSYPSTYWPKICPDYCGGKQQSPIDIDTTTNTAESEVFIPSGYTDPISTVNIKNNGHSATISWDTSYYTCSVSGGGLGADYTLAQFHFHWGCDNSKGSEHTVDGHRYAMEMHFVHYKTSYGSLGDAIQHSDGLAVLGVFFNVGAENAALKPITDNLSQITTPGTDADIAFNVALEELLPSTYDNFYRYKGSLTTPTCNEVVIWSVIKAPIELSQAQLDAFRSLEDHEGHYLCDNYREVQPLNGRTVAEYN